MLIILFQNMLLGEENFSILFWNFKVVISIPMFISFISGILCTICISIFLKSQNDEWEE